MKKTKQEVLDIISSYPIEELKKTSFMAFRLVEHLLNAQKTEKRDREKARLKIALSLINKWLNEYGN